MSVPEGYEYANDVFDRVTDAVKISENGLVIERPEEHPK